MTRSIEERLEELGIRLPEAPAPAANYVGHLVHDGRLYISGQLPMAGGGLKFSGRLGDDVSLEDGQAAAGLCAINILAQAKAALGDLERIRACLRIAGFVASTPDFTDQPKVVNGASDLLGAVLGERGRHTRVAVGCAALPLNASVEVEALFAVEI